MHPKDTNGMAKGVDPGRPKYSGSLSYVWERPKPKVFLTQWIIALVYVYGLHLIC